MNMLNAIIAGALGTLPTVAAKSGGSDLGTTPQGTGDGSPVDAFALALLGALGMAMPQGGRGLLGKDQAQHLVGGTTSDQAAEDGTASELPLSAPVKSAVVEELALGAGAPAVDIQQVLALLGVTNAPVTKPTNASPDASLTAQTGDAGLTPVPEAGQQPTVALGSETTETPGTKAVLQADPRFAATGPNAPAASNDPATQGTSAAHTVPLAQTPIQVPSVDAPRPGAAPTAPAVPVGQSSLLTDPSASGAGAAQGTQGGQVETAAPQGQATVVAGAAVADHAAATRGVDVARMGEKSPPSVATNLLGSVAAGTDNGTPIVPASPHTDASADGATPDSGHRSGAQGQTTGLPTLNAPTPPPGDHVGTQVAAMQQLANRPAPQVTSATPDGTAAAATGAAQAATATATPAAPAAPPPPQGAAPQPPMPQQVMAKLNSAVRTMGNGTHELAIKVTPADLGPIRVVANISDGHISIELHSASQAGREMLRLALPDLRRDIVAPGMSTTLDMSAGDDGSPTGSNASNSSQLGSGSGDRHGARTATDTADGRRAASEDTPKRADEQREPSGRRPGTPTGLDVVA